MPAAPKSVSVRVDADTYERAKALAGRERVSITRVIELAVEAAARRAFYAETNAAIERLRADPEAWAAYEAESRDLDASAADGLDPEEGLEWDESLVDAASW
jgi:predicted transcriptional regulator